MVSLTNESMYQGYCGEDGRIVELTAVSMVNTVFRYAQLVQMF
jgi:hypothetical protein